jgi:hypothetical protein
VSEARWDWTRHKPGYWSANGYEIKRDKPGGSWRILRNGKLRDVIPSLPYAKQACVRDFARTKQTDAVRDPRGVYAKFNVERTDGSSAPGGRHDRCAYFVLDLEHDPFAKVALKAYATACAETHPGLARDLTRIALAERSDPSACGCREAMCSHTVGVGLSPSETADLLMMTRKP